MSLDDAVRICREICRLPEYAARLKPDMTDYEWITYGEQVKVYNLIILKLIHFLIITPQTK